MHTITQGLECVERLLDSLWVAAVDKHSGSRDGCKPLRRVLTDTIGRARHQIHLVLAAVRRSVNNMLFFCLLGNVLYVYTYIYYWSLKFARQSVANEDRSLNWLTLVEQVVQSLS